jgi:adenylate cyclase
MRLSASADRLSYRTANRAGYPRPVYAPTSVGINLGDVLVEEDGDIFGDGVNIAARLEQLAPPGGIYLSAKVYEEARDKLPYRFQDQSEQSVKNITKLVWVYSLFNGSLAAQHASLAVPDRPSIAVLPFDYMSENRGQRKRSSQ